MHRNMHNKIHSVISPLFRIKNADTETGWNVRILRSIWIISAEIRYLLSEQKKLLLYTGSSFSLWKVTKIIFLFHQNYFSRKKFCGYRFRLHVLLLKLSTVSINSLLRRVEFIDFCGWFLHASFLSDHFFRVIHMKK